MPNVQRARYAVSDDLSIGPWRVDPDTSSIDNGETHRKLQPRQMTLLLALIDAAGQLCRRQDLLETVWGSRVVNEEALSRTIAELRQLLDDDARHPRFIQTIPKKGYRLLVDTTQNRRERPPWRGRPALIIGAVVIGVILLAALWLLDDARQQQASLLDTRPLLGSGQLEYQARFTHDGSRIVHVLLGPGQSSAIQLTAVSGDAPAQTLKRGQRLRSPVFSDDGQTLVWTEMRDQHSCQVMVQRPGQTTGQALAHCWQGGRGAIDLAPNGDFLVFTYPGKDPFTAGLAVLNLHNETVVPLTDPPAGQADQDPRYSADGREILFGRGNVITRELFSIRLGTRPELRQWTFDQQLVEGADWVGPEHVVYASDRDGRLALRSLRFGQTPVGVGGDGARYPDYSPATGQLVYQRSIYQCDIIEVDLTTGSPSRTVLSSRRYDNHPTLSPDGQHIAFISNRTDRSAVWLARADGSQPRMLIQTPGGRLSRPAWSPDSQTVLASVFTSKGSHLVEVDASTGDSSEVPIPGPDANTGRYLDHDTILYLDRGRVMEWRKSTETYRLRADVDANRIQVTPAGRVLLSMVAEDGVWELTAEDQLLRVAELPLASEWEHWIAGEQFLYFHDEGQIKRLSFATGQIEPAADVRPSAVGLTMAVSADEASMLVAQTVDMRINLMIATWSP